ncbi:MAG: hypothetical protein M3070_07965 [Actinomycetota bacterium]|nr:hypothetical protein [Actinomycetota bacterium]
MAAAWAGFAAVGFACFGLAGTNGSPELGARWRDLEAVELGVTAGAVGRALPGAGA